jgi:hypothetical protein
MLAGKSSMSAASARWRCLVSLARCRFKMAGSVGIINHKHSKELLSNCLHNAGLSDVQLLPIKLQDEPASRALQVYMQNPHIIPRVAKWADCMCTAAVAEALLQVCCMGARVSQAHRDMQYKMAECVMLWGVVSSGWCCKPLCAYV